MSFEIAGDPAVDERQRPAADSHTREPRVLRRRSSCRSSPDAASPIATPPTARRCASSTKPCRAGTCSGRTGARACGSRCGPRRGRAPSPPSCEIVGVVRQVRGRPDEREAFVQIYRPIAQRPTDDIYLVVRPATGDAAALTRRCAPRSPASIASSWSACATSRRSRTWPGPRPSAIGSAPCSSSPSPAWRSRWRWSASSASSATPCSSGCATSPCGGRSAPARATSLRLVVRGVAPVFAAGLAVGLLSPPRWAGCSARCWSTSIRSIR